MTDETLVHAPEDRAISLGRALGRRLLRITCAAPRAIVAVACVAAVVHPGSGGATLVAIGAGAAAATFIALDARSARRRGSE